MLMLVKIYLAISLHYECLNLNIHYSFYNNVILKHSLEALLTCMISVIMCSAFKGISNI